MFAAVIQFVVTRCVSLPKRRRLFRLNAAKLHDRIGNGLTVQRDSPSHAPQTGHFLATATERGRRQAERRETYPKPPLIHSPAPSRKLRAESPTPSVNRALVNSMGQREQSRGA